MIEQISLETILSSDANPEGQPLTIFALLNLGILESLSNGTMSASDVTTSFFHAENCKYVQEQLNNENADRIMSHGVQLEDLFEILPPIEAQREFLRELSIIRTLCLSLIEPEQLAA